MLYRRGMNRTDQSSVWIQANADWSLKTLERRRAELLRLRAEQLSCEIRIGKTCVSDQLFDFKVADDGRTNMVPEGKYGIVHAIYLAAIGVAMIGWLWLIAWCALQLI